jgi:hypothetical protein
MRGEIVNTKKINKWLHLSGIEKRRKKIRHSGWLHGLRSICGHEKTRAYSRLMKTLLVTSKIFAHVLKKAKSQSKNLAAYLT